MSQQQINLINKNEYYFQIITDRCSEEDYLDIVDYLDIRFPEWDKNKNLGEHAPEFLGEVLSLYEDIIVEENSNKNPLATLYENIDDIYNRYDLGADYYTLTNLEFEFETYFDQFEEDTRTMTGKEFNYFYDQEYQKFMNEWKEKTPYILRPIDLEQIENSIYH